MDKSKKASLVASGLLLAVLLFASVHYKYESASIEDFSTAAAYEVSGELSDTVKSLERQTATNKAGVASNKADVITVNTKANTANEKADTNKEEIERTNGKVTANKDAINTNKGAIDTLNGKVKTNTEGVTTAKKGVSDNKETIDSLELAVSRLERRVLAQEKDAAHLRSVSEVRITNPTRPTRNKLVPNKVIEYRGRTSYNLQFYIISTAVRPYWTNIFHIGDTNGIRSPGIWQYPSNRRAIHFRQSGENYPHRSGNWGCDPTDSVTPPLNRWYRVNVVANKNAYTVSYNGQQRCRAVFDVAPPAGQQHVWFSDPWYHAAPVVIKGLYFKVY